MKSVEIHWYGVEWGPCAGRGAHTLPLTRFPPVAPPDYGSLAHQAHRKSDSPEATSWKMILVINSAARAVRGDIEEHPRWVTSAKPLRWVPTSARPMQAPRGERSDEEGEISTWTLLLLRSEFSTLVQRTGTVSRFDPAHRVKIHVTWRDGWVERH